MKWLGRWLKKQIRYSDECDLVPAAALGSEWAANINIGITTALGGKIVSFRRYDRKTDQYNNRIYIISDDQDFNCELGKLITLEAIQG